MPQRRKPDLKPRRLPRQARSQITVEAIFEATIQVLLTEGLQRLTTIRVSERAGVSVGTLYQYFPNKQALLLGALQRHLARVGERVGHVAAQVHHRPLAVMMPVVIDAFVSAKTDLMDEARALALVADQLESKDVVHAAAKRGRAVLTDMLETATDARFEDAGLIAFFLTSALIGAVRVVVEGGAPQKAVRVLRGQLASLCLGYLKQEAGRG